MVNLNRTVADVIDTNIPHWAALTAVTTDAENGAYAPGVTTGTLTVTLHEDEDVRSWLNQEGATDPNDKLEGAYAEYACSTVLGASMDGGKTIIPLYIAPDGSQMVGKLEFPVSTEESVTHVVEFFELQDGNPITSGEGEDAKPVPFFGIYTSFVAQQAVFLGEDDVTFTTPADWPEDGQRVFGDQLTAPFTLSFTVVDQSATWKDTSKVTIRDSEGKLVDEDAHFLWESSNPQVATINEKGEITILTNGAVSFTLTALNGNVEKAPADPPQEATTYAYTYATPEILVGVGNSPFLTVPGSLRTTTVRGGQPATVLWSSNLTEKNRDNAAGVEEPDSVETTFTLTLYKAGDFDESAGGPKEGAQGEALDPVVSSMKDVKSSALIPADKIPYANGQPYYVTISATDNATGKPYTSWAKIEVQSPPAVVELARPSSLYITDEVDTLPLTWSLANFNGDGKEFRLVITNNTTSAVQGTDVNAGNQSGSFTMNIADVTNGYRDTYTVEVAAKNATDSTWSYDSFVIYVYDRVALQQFVVDGKDTANGSAITLSNGEKEYIQKLIDSQNSTAAQQAVWDTGRDISLTADVSMDPDKPWLEVPDQFAWSAEDTTAASGTGQTHATLNYQQGALYEDITRYQRTSYGPAAEFRLSGLSDGTTKVTAEHVNTGTVAELIVNVDTLQDKLFLFQFTPAVETTLRYTNGDGVQKEVTSMADGRAAIYEESGIQGDVYLESQQGDTEYFGTLYNENLVSSEKDSTQLEDTKASYVQWNGASFGEEDIHAFPDPASTDAGEGEGADAQANQESIQGGDNQLRLAGTNSAAIAAWTRVTETLAKEPGSAVTEDEQLLMMNSSEILASVWDGKEWVTTRLTQNSSADMAPVVAVGGGKALVAWRAVAASDSGAPTEFDSYDTIQYKVYDFKEKNWSGPYTLYNGTSGAVKGMEAQMTESGAMAVAYTIEKGSTSSTTRAVTLPDCRPAGRKRQRDCLPADLHPGERHTYRPDSAGRGRRRDSAAHHIQPEGRWRGLPLWGEPDRSQHGPYGDCPVPNPPAHGGWGRGRGHHHLSGDRRRLPDRNHLDGAPGVPARHRDSKRQPLRCKRHRQPHLQPAGGHHHLGHCCHLRGQDPHLPRGNHPSLHRRRHRRRWLHPVPHHRAGGRPRHRQRQPQPGFQRPDRDHHRHPRRGLQGGQRHCKAAQRLHRACHRPGQRQVYLHHAQRRRHRGCDLHPRGLALCGRHRGQVVLRRRGLRLPAGHYGGYERNHLRAQYHCKPCPGGADAVQPGGPAPGFRGLRLQ